MARTAPRFPRLALRSYLLLLVVGAVLPFVVLTGALLLRVLSDNRGSGERLLIDSVRTQAATLDRELTGTIRVLQVLAQSEPLARGDIATFTEEARRSLNVQPAWHSIRLVTPDGKVIANTAEVLGEAADPDSVRRLVTTGTPIVGNLRRSPSGVLAFPVRVPIRINGRVAYALTAVVTPDALAGIVASAPSTTEWTRSIVDQDGTIVARTRNPDENVGRVARATLLERMRASSEGFARDTTVEGVPVYVASVRSATYGWIASIAVPVAVLDAPVRRSLVLLLVGGLLFVLASAAGAYTIAGRISADISIATAAADALARERPIVTIGSSVREIAQLGDSLERSADLLDRRRQERDATLAAADALRAEAEQANRTKDEFLAMLGHELRNPLAPIVTAIDLLKMRGVPWLREHAVIERQVRHMVRLVGDLLDVSRITRGKIDLRREPVQIDAVVHRAVEMTAPLFQERQHRLDIAIEPDLVVFADQMRLAQVVANLLANAASYTPPGGVVRLTGRRTGGGIELVVSDNGQGLTPELLSRIFDPFVQGPRTVERREGGLGLGLPIARSLVHLHGGRMEATSEGAGRGSTFTVHLPESPAHAARVVEAAPHRPPPSPMRLLVVDDNTDAASTLQQLFAESGHEVRIAADAAEALALLGQFSPQVGLIDIGLPEVDGYELARQIHARLGNSAPVLIALTGYGQPEDRERSRTAGFVHHLVKPVDADELMTLLASVA